MGMLASVQTHTLLMHRTSHFLFVCLVAALALGDATLLAQEKPAPPASLPGAPAAAWSQVEAMLAALRPPPDWRTRPPSPGQVTEFQKQVRVAALACARQAREFASRFPTNDHAGEGRIMAVYALTHAVAAGEPAAEAEIQKHVAAVMADPSLGEDDRVGVLLYAGNTVCMKRVGMRLFTEGLGKHREEFEANSLATVRSALRQYPSNSMPHTFLVATADRARGERRKELATEVIQAPGAPGGAKTLAKHMLQGTQPYQVGQPLAIRFTALDGRVVDLAQLKGKVVLVEFWSTTCGPCVAEMPTVKAAYEKFHGRGFEVIGISLDSSEAALRRFLKEKALPWPQHFDGRHWENQFAVQYGVFGIPTLWLVDTNGNLRLTNARGNLEQPVEALVAEPTSATQPQP